MISCCVIASCADSDRRKRSDYFSVPQNNQREIIIDSLLFINDSLVLPNTSYNGYTQIHNGKIYFADKYFAWIYEIENDLKKAKKHVGQGRGHGEIPLKKLAAYTIDAEGNHLIYGASNDIYTISSNFDYKGRYNYYVDSYRHKEKWNSANFYCPSYGDIVFKKYRNHYYFNVNGGDNEFNPVINDYFFDVAHIILEVSDSDGDVTRIMGRISPVVKYMTAFYFSNYDMDSNGNFYINFKCDTLVYKYDNDFNLLSSFGFAGINMDMNYEQIPNNGLGGKLRVEEMQTKGYFANITICGDYVFRPYKTGGKNNQSRMQIYKNEVLIGDIETPELLKVAGYIEPYFYSEIIGDEDAMRLTIYRFKL